MTLRVAALLLLALAALLPLWGETTTGGSAETWLQGMIDPSTPLASRLDGGFTYRPAVRVGNPDFEFYVQGLLGWNPRTASAKVDLEAFEISLEPAGFLKVVMGRTRHRPGSAAFLSPTDWFSTLDLEALLQGRILEAALPADIAQVRLFWGDLAAVLTVAPFRRGAVIPDTGSPWFPRKDFPSSIHITFPTDEVLVLERLLVEIPAETPSTLMDTSVSAELALSLPSVDLAVLYYHGADSSPLFSARFDFPHGLFQGFDVILSPVERTVDCFGLDAVLSVAGLRAWADASFTLSKVFLTRRLSVDNFSSVLETSPALEYACGAGYDFSLPHLSIDAEWKGCWITAPPADVMAPLLSSLLYVRAFIRLGQDRFLAGASAIVSTSDWSLAVVTDLAFAPSNELSFQLLVPVFLGGSGTELGQFSGNHLVSLAATWRF